jgi:hypothetical protein
MHKIRYTSYRQGAIIEVEIEDSTWEQLEKDYHEVEDFCQRHGIETLEQYVRAVLMMQR